MKRQPVSVVLVANVKMTPVTAPVSVVLVANVRMTPVTAFTLIYTPRRLG